MQSTTAHRLVELQSPADLVHLETRARNVARAKLDLHLPLNAAPGGGEDVLRTEVEAMVERFVEETFRGVRTNISVNGMAWEESQAKGGSADGDQQEDFEPLDTALASRIRALEAQKMALTERVADLRRTAPGESARRWQDAFETSSRQQNDEMDKTRQGDLERAPMEGAKLEVGELERWDEVQGTWETGLQGLAGLKSGLTETVARLERAKGVVEYLDGKQ